jgi:hypothetical protein
MTSIKVEEIDEYDGSYACVILCDRTPGLGGPTVCQEATCGRRRQRLQPLFERLMEFTT